MKSYRTELTLNLAPLRETLLDRTTPIWRPLSTVEFARLTGISVQTLSNWRMRGNGPPFFHEGKARRCMYRPHDLLGWLTGSPSWHFIRAWAVRRGLAPEDADEAFTDWLQTLF